MLKGTLHLEPARTVGRVLQAEFRISTGHHRTVRVEDLDETDETVEAHVKRCSIGLVHAMRPECASCGITLCRF